ncbi:putative receptor-like protein kinase [Hibiscus syriacus]|uniref:Receptor-like protein kinase n=1 Tax=Hibiscus syriacus TaxID=106335 RepID=A0A6A2WUN7_HIBSY|nr:uncharacterized protein LOC120182321 [Hibiscus syriacus]KAE8665223.1 putative receptor-like protein kinase [Hibiscus syriacus]
MCVAVLKPDDCLKLPNPMKHHKNLYPKPNRSNRVPQNRKNQFPMTSPPPTPSACSKSPARNLVMGQVKILKRGEYLEKPSPQKSVGFEKENIDVDLGSTNRLGPDPGSIPTQIRLTESNSKSGNDKFVPVSFYSGSAFIASPPPSSVPMPVFFTKTTEVSVKNNDATSDLRRILRLD